MSSNDNTGHRHVELMVADQSEAIIETIVNQCKRTIMQFKEKGTENFKTSYVISSNRDQVEVENIVSDFKDGDLANLYVEYLTRQKLYTIKTWKERSRRIAMTRSRENMSQLLQLMKEEISRKRSMKARAMEISDPDTRDLMQWLEDLPSPMPEKMTTQQKQDALSADDIHVFEMVIVLYEWGRKVIVNLLSSMMTSSESEMVVSFGKMFDFLSDILAFIPDMSDQMSKRLRQEADIRNHQDIIK